MFAVNGPSGPTSRHERRVKSDRQREEEEETRRRWTEKKREHFFLEKRAQAASSEHGKEKAKKLAAQARSDIFKGCRIVFNGRTGKVSSYYLAKLVQEHGGNVASMLTSTRVTHMVGSNLNGSKADKVLKSSGSVKFVSSGKVPPFLMRTAVSVSSQTHLLECHCAEWILQCVKHKKRQPEFEFLVYKDSDAASSLHAAFSRAAPSTK
ncbi:hypothetical protein PHYPSEUDO_000209 [Phytophthora pseudosyringae]|uniref:BRCT domain-containing protein n=1 Tax=Phytophthora pseudosyringae TaxID=221518 RepID=A0A8T1WH41_9STRA|nr:hypothetical protein PHYPSEUDO_000209 [Phytophthora pseudosyringae]